MPSGISREWLAVSGDLSLPLLVARGAAPGPVFAVTEGVHGDEVEGVRAIFDVFDSLDTAALRGAILAVTVVNPPAHRACQRTNPADAVNLARVFPGRDQASVSEQIAAVSAREVIGKADFYLDLHSGGVRYAMPSMAVYASSDQRGGAAAEAFGAPVIRGHPIIEPVRTISVASDSGIPFLYARLGAQDGLRRPICS